MEFREYMERIGMEVLNEKDIIPKVVKAAGKMTNKEWAEMRKNVMDDENFGTVGWMNHLNAKWARVYDVFFSREKSVQEYESVSPYGSDKVVSNHIVDVGAGTGILTNYIAHKNPEKTVVALDVSEATLRESMKKRDILKLENIEFVVCDARYMPIKSSLKPHVYRTRLSEENLPMSEYQQIRKEIKRISS